MLVSVSEECDQKIQAMHQEERLEIKNMKMEKHHLLNVIEKMKEENNSLQMQVSKLLEEMANTYLLFRNESDARKILIAEINALKYQQEAMKTAYKTDEHGEDPVTLAIALRVARKDLTQVQVELNTMKADYGDVVPRRNFNNQEKKLAEYSQKIEVLQKDLLQLQTEHKSLLEIHNQVLLKDSAKEQQSKDTPHPAWDNCADVFPEDTWLTLSAEKSSDQLVSILLTELGTRTLSEKDFFTGKGKEEDVPIHLRYDGLVKNLRLSIGDVSNLLQEVWKEKMTLDAQNGKQSSMPEFFFSYLQNKFGDAAIEWSYAVHESCRVQLISEEMQLFYNILMGKVKEDESYLLMGYTDDHSANDSSLISEQLR
ncbi:Hypothetical predicted protein [Pelobates cultripes]|uniref:Uncharacterized protein n=1 Tax=Pelobates cultripes TaxID=61616 RepID=A0AAD1TDV8_PELCU|nr:Hypothetical predicted protein [Pelobates cultripes]